MDTLSGPSPSSSERQVSRPRQSVHSGPSTVAPPSTRMSVTQLESLPETRRESRKVSDFRRGSQFVQPHINESMSQRRSSWLRRPSVASSYYKTTNSGPTGLPRTNYENTYRMKPREDQRFQPHLVKQFVAELLHSYLDGELYDPKMCAQLSTRLSELIKARVKELGFVRHKFVCHVTIGQVGGQSIRCGSRCIWDSETDGFATATYQNSSLFASATVYAVYFE